MNALGSSTLLSTVPSSAPWRFDPTSFGVGVAAGFFAAWMLYRSRERIAEQVEAFRERVMDLRRRLFMSVEARYRESMMAMVQQALLLARWAPLDVLFVPPRLVVPPFLLPASTSDLADDQASRLELAWKLLNPPQRTISLRQAVDAAPRLLLLGETGSGRTTVLMAMAHAYMSPLPNEAVIPPEEEGVPFYVPLDEVVDRLPQETDPRALIRPVATYLRDRSSPLIRGAIEGFVRDMFQQGRAVCLLDNGDRVPEERRKALWTWLARFLEAYPNNRCVLVGPQVGYWPLLQIGFLPFRLLGFDREDAARFWARWLARDQVAERETEGGEGEEEELVAEVELQDEQPAMALPGFMRAWRWPVRPLDLAIGVWYHQVSGADPSADIVVQMAQILAATVDSLPDHPLDAVDWGEALSTLALESLEKGVLSFPRDSLLRDVQNRLLEAWEIEAEFLDEGGGEEDKPSTSLSERALRAQAEELVDAWVQGGGILVDRGGETLAFAHPIWQGYLAARVLTLREEIDRVVERRGHAAWQETCRFCAALGAGEPLLNAYLQEADDLFLSNTLAAAEYLRWAPSVDPKRRGSVLATLARVFLDPQQPVPLRRRALEALISIPDRGVEYLLTQAAHHADARIRQLGIMGLGYLPYERVTPTLIQALQDDDALVRAVAAYALGRRGDEASLDGLVEGLQHEDEWTRRIAAEAFALAGPSGYEILREALRVDDVHIRRAAVWGLGAVREPWVGELLQQAYWDESEWFVRSAIEEVQARLTAPPPALAWQPARVDEAEWLIRWAAERGTGVGTGAAAFRMLTQVLREGDEMTRLLAVETLRRTRDPNVAPLLLQALSDSFSPVRDTAFEALWEIHSWTGQRISPATSSGSADREHVAASALEEGGQ